MSVNSYATPQSDLQVDQKNKPTFFIVSTTKLAVMIVMTFGFYYYYWSYRNWKLYKSSTGANILPLLRAYFNVFFVYSLFQRINQGIEQSGRSVAWSPKFRAVTLIGVQLLTMIPGLFFFFELSLILSLVLLGVNTSLLIGAQRAINYLEEDPRGEGNAKFTPLNYLWMLVGILWWGQTLVGGIILLGMANRGTL
jgi:hypothetical protein